MAAVIECFPQFYQSCQNQHCLVSESNYADGWLRQFYYFVSIKVCFPSKLMVYTVCGHVLVCH